MTDIEIAQGCALAPIDAIAEAAGIEAGRLEHYGRYKAKIAGPLPREKPDGRLVLVTAITPTPAGEGKTTTTIGLADALRRLGKRCAAALREPSLGPVFGVKGGAAGGGHAQVVPMEDINLHFTGDFHAVGAAHNLLAAMIDNHLYQGNALGLDPGGIAWRRVVDMNDRQLRSIVSGLGGRGNGTPREDGFDITVASEVMAILCLSRDLADLKARLGRIVVGRSREGALVTAGDLKAAGAMAVLLKDAIKPNLVQTLEGTPVFIHGGPFANIAHGCNSLIATRWALKTADYAVTEAGFGADLGAEKFLDITCRAGEDPSLPPLFPRAVVLVASVRALKHHGGAADLTAPDLPRLEKGLPNLLRHLDNLTSVYGLPVVVALNRFPGDTEEELALVEARCRAAGARAARSEVWARGGAGGEDLAREVLALCEGSREPPVPRHAYETSDTIEEKIRRIAGRVYHAAGVEFLPGAKRQLKALTAQGFGALPVCVAKTQYSFSDNPRLRGAPEGFVVTIRDLRVSAGAGFIVALAGDIMTMPGLPPVPAAEGIDIDSEGRIVGLF